ncbi:MAG: universal stress protein [Bacteroidales bacterium]|jgi:nucleotide-binding universal stress UspA family protein|nr:universal stress protein [Bacteroidales bacterium]NLM93199.1 universal stress protein [Bacteroidales bacterium]
MSQARNKILVPVDLGGHAENVLEQAYPIARVFGAEILMLFVIEDEAGISKLISPDDYLTRLMFQAKEQFDRIDNLIEQTGKGNKTPVSYIIKKGKVYDQIIETAREQDVILIVMGRDDGDAKRIRRFMGSNTFNVVREANCPVITLKGDKVYSCFRNILVPIDLTGQTKRQVQKAIELGKFFGATIYLVSVITKEGKVRRLMKNVQINQVRNAIERHGINCSSEILTGEGLNIPRQICTMAQRTEADMIIIMTQQKKNFPRFFVGSIAQEIIFMACVPVLSISPKAEFNPKVITSFLDPMNVMNSRQDRE